MKKETDKLPQTEGLNIGVVKAMLHNDSKMENFLQQRSQLYTAYGVKDNDGKFRSVIDMQSVTDLLKELLCNLP